MRDSTDLDPLVKPPPLIKSGFLLRMDKLWQIIPQIYMWNSLGLALRAPFCGLESVRLSGAVDQRVALENSDHKPRTLHEFPSPVPLSLSSYI